MKINWVEVGQILSLNMNVQVVEFCNIWLTMECKQESSLHIRDFRDFKIQDATASRTRWLINGLGLERRRLSGKSKVKIPVWM